LQPYRSEIKSSYSFKATFSNGMQPNAIEFLDTLRSRIKIGVVTTVLEVLWYQPCHVMRLLRADLANAVEIKSAPAGKEVRGLRMHHKLSPSTHGRWTVEVTNATESIDAEAILAAIPAHIQEPLSAKSGPPLGDPHESGIGIVKTGLQTWTNRIVSGAEMRPSRNLAKFRAVFEFEGTRDGNVASAEKLRKILFSDLLDTKNSN
jgi:hypothetical protein